MWETALQNVLCVTWWNLCKEKRKKFSTSHQHWWSRLATVETHEQVCLDVPVLARRQQCNRAVWKASFWEATNLSPIPYGKHKAIEKFLSSVLSHTPQSLKFFFKSWPPNWVYEWKRERNLCDVVKKWKSVAQCVGYGRLLYNLRNSITGHKFCYLCVCRFLQQQTEGIVWAEYKNFILCVQVCVCMCLPLLVFTFLR